MELVVGRLGRPHGVQGEISVEIRTDEPEERFKNGVTLFLKENKKNLTVSTSRWHQQKMLVKFDEITDRDMADEIKGKTLMVTIDENQLENKKDQYYEFQLVNLNVKDNKNNLLGKVKEVISGNAQDLIVVEANNQKEVMVPFVKQIVKDVDLVNKEIKMDPPPGLFDEENALDAR